MGAAAAGGYAGQDVRRRDQHGETRTSPLARAQPHYPSHSQFSLQEVSPLKASSKERLADGLEVLMGWDDDHLDMLRGRQDKTAAIREEWERARENGFATELDVTARESKL